jgi:hypothetical protein
MPGVVVQIQPEPPAALAEAAIDGCQGALGAGRCRLATDRPGVLDFHAIVRFENEALEVVRVELRRRSPDGALLEARELYFAEPDTPLQRSASVGVVIAALVVAHQRHATPERPPPVAPRPKPKPAERVHGERLRLDLGATATRALEESSTPALGAAARGSLIFGPTFVMASVGYERGLETLPDVSWLIGGLGIGVRLGASTAPLAAELHTELVATRVEVAAERTDPPRQESDSRLRFGPRLGLDGVFGFAPELALVAGAQGSVLRPAVAIDIEGRRAERAPAFSWGGFLSLRWAPRAD